jgi:polyphosphate kinase 2
LAISRAFGARVLALNMPDSPLVLYGLCVAWNDRATSRLVDGTGGIAMDDFYTTFVRELPVDEWGHPVLPKPEKLKHGEYVARLLTLQIELVKMQQWARATGERVLLLFEGRDTAGKGGTIQRMREHMNPRFARHVALPTPNEIEEGQWYFQRYVEQLPTRGEIAFFDRSWYNRAGVERVMGFATDREVTRFFDQVVPFEQFLVDDGIHLIKIWLSVGRAEQAQRLDARRQDPLKQWKLSSLDERAPSLWEEYTLAALELFRRTDAAHAPWWFVNNNNKRVGRLAIIQHVLSLLPYDNKNETAIGQARPDIVAPVRALLPMIAPDDPITPRR